MNQKPARARTKSLEGKGPLGVKQTILSYIKSYQAQVGYPPTIQEIAEAVGKGRSTVHYHLEGLEIEGQIERQGHSPRAIKVLEGRSTTEMV